jgi:hypothetical protein
MRFFIKKVAVLTVLVMLFVTFMTCYNFSIQPSLLSSSEESKEMLILGDSRVLFGLDPSKFKSAFNSSTHGSTYPHMYSILKEYHSRCNFNTVLLTFSHHNLSGFNDENILKSTFQNKYVDLFNPFHLPKWVGKQNYFVSFVQSYGLNPMNEFYQLKGGYQGKHGTLIKTSMDSIVYKHFYQEDSMYQVSSFCLSYLDSISDFCKRNSIDLKLISMPTHSNYREGIPDLYKEVFDNKLSELSISSEVLNYSEFEMDSIYFIDTSHLNEKGARMMSKVISKRIELGN